MILQSFTFAGTTWSGNVLTTANTWTSGSQVGNGLSNPLYATVILDTPGLTGTPINTVVGPVTTPLTNYNGDVTIGIEYSNKIFIYTWDTVNLCYWGIGWWTPNNTTVPNAQRLYKNTTGNKANWTTVWTSNTLTTKDIYHITPLGSYYSGIMKTVLTQSTTISKRKIVDRIKSITPTRNVLRTANYIGDTFKSILTESASLLTSYIHGIAYYANIAITSTTPTITSLLKTGWSRSISILSTASINTLTKLALHKSQLITSTQNLINTATQHLHKSISILSNYNLAAGSKRYLFKVLNLNSSRQLVKILSIVRTELLLSTPILTLNTVVTKLISLISYNTLTYKSSKFWTKPWNFVYSLSKWIGVKHNSCLVVSSTDGTTWTKYNLTKSGKWSGITSNGTTIIAIMRDSIYVNISNDAGLTWTEAYLPNSRDWVGICTDGTNYIAYALDSDKVAISSNGISWVEYDILIKANWMSMAWNGSVFCAITDSSITAVSSDGINWTQGSMPDNIHYNSITWALGQFTAVASGPTNLAATSTDGINWNRITLPVTADWTSVGPGVGNPNV